MGYVKEPEEWKEKQRKKCWNLYLFTFNCVLFLWVVVSYVYHNEIFGVEPKRNPHPIIFVPGLGGNRLEAKLDKEKTLHAGCSDKKTDDYELLWVDPKKFLWPWHTDCFADNIKLEYDRSKNKTRDTDGVSIRVPGFGEISTMRWVDDWGMIRYFADIVKHLLFARKNFSSKVNLKGAPYDFRKSPLELGDYFKDLEKLVEETYEMNKHKSVVFVCHGLGCPTTLYFLNQKTKAWKDKYVRAMITLSAPWGGSMGTLKALVSGDNLGVPFIDPVQFRTALRTFPSLYYLLPSDKFWSQDKVLVSQIMKDYTVNDYKAFFEDMVYPDGYRMWLNARNLTYDLIPPEVEVHCLHGAKVDTPERLVFDLLADYDPMVVYGDGDGQVNLRSLQGCLQWVGKQAQPVHHILFEKTDHKGILSSQDVHYYIGNITLA